MADKGNSGVSLLTVFQVVFIVLKLTDLISWSWPVVLIPFWISLGIIAVAILVVIIKVVKDGR